MSKRIRIEWGPDVGEIYYEAGTELIGPNECLGVLSKDGYVAQYISQLKAETEALREAIADLYKQRMGKISTIKLETGLLAHDIYIALLTEDTPSEPPTSDVPITP